MLFVFNHTELRGVGWWEGGEEAVGSSGAVGLDLSCLLTVIVRL